MKSIKKNNKGFSLIEILVAIVVIALAGSYVLNGFVQAARMNAQAQRIQDATDLGQVTAEVFNRKDLSVLLAGFISNGCLTGSDPATIVLCAEGGTPLADDMQLTASDTTASAVKTKLDAAGSNYEVHITGLPQTEVMPNSSSQRYKIDIVLKSGSYGINDDKVTSGYQKITSTYKQQELISQTQDGKQEVFLNNFIVPDIRETNDNLVISTNDYSDSAAINEYLEYASREYAFQSTPITSLQYDQIYQTNMDAMMAHLSGTGKAFYDGNITSVAYGGTGGLGISPQRTLNVTLECKNQGGNMYAIYVLMNGVYTFNDFTFNGKTIPAKTITVPMITEADGKNFVVSASSGTTEDVKKIYFYYNAADKISGYYFSDLIKAVDGSSDKMNLEFSGNTSVLATDVEALKKKLKESGFYVVTQRFKDASGNECISLFQDSAAAFTVVTTNKTDIYESFECYSNMMKWDGSGAPTQLKPPNVKGFITDGNDSLVGVYDMEISIKIKDQEFANIKTVKGE